MSATLIAPPPRAEQTQTYATRYFKGVENVRALMRDAIREKRKQKKFSEVYLDTICRFGTDLPGKGTRLPTCSEFEQNPEKYMTSLVFSLASFPLELNIDEVLPIALNDTERSQVAKEMETRRAGARRGAAGPDTSLIPLQDQAEVYVLSRVLSEVDKETTPIPSKEPPPLVSEEKEAPLGQLLK